MKVGILIDVLEVRNKTKEKWSLDILRVIFSRYLVNILMDFDRFCWILMDYNKNLKEN